MASLLRGYPVRQVPMEYMEFLICREMGWTFTELEAQPGWRIDQAMAFLSEEAKARKTRGD